MASAADAHKHLTDFCKGQPGVAIGKELIAYVFKNAVVQANADGAGGGPIVFPSNNPWQSFRVGFTMKLDPATVSLNFAPLAGPSGSDPLPQLRIAGLHAELGIYVDHVLFSTHTLTYSEIIAAFAIDAKKLRLVKRSIKSKWEKVTADPDPKELWRNLNTLSDGTPFTAQLKADWETQERAYMILAQDAMGTSFIEAVTLPNILGMIKAFEFTGAISLSATTEVLMLTGRAEWIFGCSRRAEDVALNGTAPLAGEAGKLPPTTFSLPNGEGDGYPPMPNPEPVHFGDAFVHLPTVFMQRRFDGIAKPSVTFSDEGTIAIIHWHYEGSVAPASGSTLAISLVNSWPTEFKVSLPLQTFGAAGAGVKIACVYYEAAGLHYRGEINPFESFFMIGLDFSKGDLFFESRLGQIKAVDFVFDTSPRFEFPISEIADALLGQIASDVINSQAGRILNVTRFSIADFDLFKGFGKLSNVLTAVPDADATTYGVSFLKHP